MSINTRIQSPLEGRSVALPESRQLDVLATMFERRGAIVSRTPLVTILDSPNKVLIENWIREFIDNPPDYFIVLTGEGIRRLVGFASRAECLEEFVKTLSQVVKICRGPKPGRALKEIGVDVNLTGKAPTTRGIIETLEQLSLEDKRIAVQLYGEDPNRLLADYLATRNADCIAVAPYIYADEIHTEQVLDLVDNLARGKVDIIAFTSKVQFTRLANVAKANGQEALLLTGLKKILVAAVGPIVAAQLQEFGVIVDVCPQQLFFMKPMLREIEKCLSDKTV